jgi:hypothetical protein
MVFSDFEKMTADIKNLFRHQKTGEFSATMTVPIDALKIENPTNKTGATHNRVNKVNKLVTVFALCPCTRTDINCLIPRSRSGLLHSFVSGDNHMALTSFVTRNSYTYNLCTWMAKTAPCFASSGCE